MNIEDALKSATLERLPDGTWYAEIPSCPGVWASGRSRKATLETLREVLAEWIALGEEVSSCSGG